MNLTTIVCIPEVAANGENSMTANCINCLQSRGVAKAWDLPVSDVQWLPVGTVQSCDGLLQ